MTPPRGWPATVLTNAGPLLVVPHLEDESAGPGSRRRQGAGCTHDVSSRCLSASSPRPLVGREPDARDEFTRLECSLLDLREEVLWVAVQGHDADLDQGEVTVRPDFVRSKGSMRCGFAGSYGMTWIDQASGRCCQSFISSMTLSVILEMVFLAE